ncbi:unnamed protein product [Camellia sinensis]
MESSRKKLRKEKDEEKEKWRTQPNSILKTNRFRCYAASKALAWMVLGVEDSFGCFIILVIHVN